MVVVVAVVLVVVVVVVMGIVEVGKLEDGIFFVISVAT